MQPTRAPEATLNDLLDRILDKGLVLRTDLIISVAGIPLLGLNLNLALAGIETMLEYGIMRDWDEAQRVVASKEAKRNTPVLTKSEDIILSMFGTHWHSKGIYYNWRPGHLSLTSKRLILFRKMPPEILFETPWENIKGMALHKNTHFTGQERKELHVLLQGNEVVKFHATDTAALEVAMQERLNTMGFTLEENPVFPMFHETEATFLDQGEEITHSGKMWHLMPLPGPGGKISDTWKPGNLYLTEKRLCWWYDFDGRLAFQLPCDRIMHVTVEKRDMGVLVKQGHVLLVLCGNGQGKSVACFTGDETALREWEEAIGERLKDMQAERGTEACPRCGRRALSEALLREGCPRCGWVSPKLKQRLQGDGHGLVGEQPCL